MSPMVGCTKVAMKRFSPRSYARIDERLVAIVSGWSASSAWKTVQQRAQFLGGEAILIATYLGDRSKLIP